MAQHQEGTQGTGTGQQAGTGTTERSPQYYQGEVKNYCEQARIRFNNLFNRMDNWTRISAPEASKEFGQAMGQVRELYTELQRLSSEVSNRQLPDIGVK